MQWVWSMEESTRLWLDICTYVKSIPGTKKNDLVMTSIDVIGTFAPFSQRSHLREWMIAICQVVCKSFEWSESYKITWSYLTSGHRRKSSRLTCHILHLHLPIRSSPLCASTLNSLKDGNEHGGSVETNCPTRTLDLTSMQYPWSSQQISTEHWHVHARIVKRRPSDHFNRCDWKYLRSRGDSIC